MASADFSLRCVSCPTLRHPFRHKARSPQVIPFTVSARAPDLRSLTLDREKLCGQPPARLCRPRLISDSCSSPRRSRYSASFSNSLTLIALQFARVAAINSPEDSHLQVNGHAGHTAKKRRPNRPPFFVSPFSFCYPWAVHPCVLPGRPQSSDRMPSLHPSTDRCEPRAAPFPSVSSPAGRSPEASLCVSSSSVHP